MVGKCGRILKPFDVWLGVADEAESGNALGVDRWSRCGPG